MRACVRFRVGVFARVRVFVGFCKRVCLNESLCANAVITYIITKKDTDIVCFMLYLLYNMRALHFLFFFA